jgi:hypothetical protein
MDGRVQLPVIDYLKKRFKVDYVDVVTEPGPNRILAKQSNAILVKSIFDRLGISVHHHGSTGIAVVGHYDCYGNLADKAAQSKDTQVAIEHIRQRYKDVPVIGLGVDENWQVAEIIGDVLGC